MTDETEKMLEDAVRGLTPLARARKLQSISLHVAALFERKGDREKEIFWKERAREAGHTADRLLRTAPRASQAAPYVEITILKDEKRH